MRRNLGIVLALSAVLGAASACGPAWVALQDSRKHDDAPASAGPTRTVSGQAVKGPIRAGTVRAYAMGADGRKTGPPLGTGTTDAGGRFSLAIPESFSGPMVVEVVGGSYEDEATGLDVAIHAGTELCLTLADTTATEGLSLTPLTTLAAELVTSRAGQRPLEDAIAEAQAQVSEIFGLQDIVRTRPADLIRETPSGVDEASKYGLILAGLSQLAKEIFDAAGEASDPGELIRALAEDIRDGTLDGLGAQGSIEVGGTGRPLGPGAATSELSDAMDEFAGTTYARRKPGGALPNGLSGKDLGQARRLYHDGAVVRRPRLPADRFTPTTAIAQAVGAKSAMGLLTEPIRDCTATRIDDDRILVCGGVAGGAVSNHAWIYRESKGRFDLLPSELQVKRAMHTATRAGDEVVIMGGVDANGDPIDAVEAFDPVTMRFERRSDMPIARAGHQAIALSSGEILVIGGVVQRMVSSTAAGGAQSVGWRFTERVDLYRPSAGTGRHFNGQANSVGGVPASMAMPRAFHQAIRLPPGPNGGDQVLVLGGLQQPASTQPAAGIATTAELFDLGSNTWTELTLPDLAPRWAGHALQANVRPDPGAPGPAGMLWDVLVYGGVQSPIIGRELLSFVPSGSNRETGNMPVDSVELIRVEHRPVLQARVIARTTLPGPDPQGKGAPMGTGASFTYLPPPAQDPARPARHLVDRYLLAGGVATFPQPIGLVFYDTAYLLDLDRTKIPEPLPIQLPIQAQGLFLLSAAGQGPLPTPNPFQAAAKLQSIRVFHAAARMSGPDGREGSSDDTVLLVGGKIDVVTASETADVYAPKQAP